MLDFLRDVAPRAARGWRWGLAALISGVILAGLLWWSGASEVSAALARADLVWLSLAAGWMLAASVCRWARLWILVPAGERAGLSLFGVIGGHAFLNQLLPLRTGELIFPVLLRRATGLPLSVGLIDLLLLRLIELAVLLPLYTLAFCAWLIEQGDQSVSGAALWVLVAIGAVSALSLPLLPALLKQAIGLGSRLLALPRLARRGGAVRLSASLGRCREELGRLGLGAVVGLTAATVLMWGCLFGVYYSALWALGVEVSALVAVVGSAGAIVTNLLPINGIGSLGTLEAGWVAGFVALGEDQAAVTASGIAMHAVIIGVLGLCALAALPRPSAQGEPEGSDSSSDS